MTEELDAYRNQRAPADVAAQVIEAYRRQHHVSHFPLGRVATVGLSAAAIVLVAFLVRTPVPEQPADRMPAPATLSLSRLATPTRPKMTMPLVPQFEIPKLHQISVDFDIQMPEEVL